MSRKLIL